MSLIYFLETFLGTTKRGIGPTYGAKANRFGLRIGDLKYWNEFKEKYMKMHSYLTKTENLKVTYNNNNISKLKG